MKNLLIAACAIALLGCSTLAHADSIKLKYRDLDYNSKEALAIWGDVLPDAHRVNGVPEVSVAEVSVGGHHFKVSLLYSDACGPMECQSRIFENGKVTQEFPACYNTEAHAVSASGNELIACDHVTIINHADRTASADSREFLVHNGSTMIADSAAGTITYDAPKASISGTVKPGALLFRASAPWKPNNERAVIHGTAYVFKRGCEPAPYAVSGHYERWHTLVLKGAAPVREKNGCRIIGYRMNGNSVLSFENLGD